MPSGGKRDGAGRPKGSKGGRRKGEAERLAVILPPAAFDSDFASRVLARIGDGPPQAIASAEDYLLTLLFSNDVQTRSYNFNRLLDRKYGRPPQGILISDTRDFSSNPSQRIAELLALGRQRLVAGAKPN